MKIEIESLNVFKNVNMFINCHNFNTWIIFLVSLWELIYINLLSPYHIVATIQLAYME